MVKKIKIITEELEIPNDNPFYEEIFVPEIETIISEDELTKYMTTAVRRLYQVKKVMNNPGETNYLVKIDDNKMFNDLLDISKDDLDRIVNEKTKELKRKLDSAMFVTAYNTKQAIKNLPFYKRLFNKF